MIEVVVSHSMLVIIKSTCAYIKSPIHNCNCLEKGKYGKVGEVGKLVFYRHRPSESLLGIAYMYNILGLSESTLSTGFTLR